jgi:hypothetical protein
MWVSTSEDGGARACAHRVPAGYIGLSHTFSRHRNFTPAWRFDQGTIFSRIAPRRHSRASARAA